MQQQLMSSSVDWKSRFFKCNHFGGSLALVGLLMLTACGGGGGKVITKNDLVDPGTDGVPPTLISVTIKMSRDKDPKPTGTVKLGQAVRIDIEASEALMKPDIMFNNMPADEIGGKIGDWYAIYNMTEADPEGLVTFSVAYEDSSGEKGVSSSETTDGSAVTYCIEGCSTGDSSLAGEWMLAGEGAAAVGPTALSAEWWASTSANGGGPADRACWFDDVFYFGEDGSFQNIMDGETWVEGWQGGTDTCGVPVAPHDGSSLGTYTYNESAGTLVINGRGSHLGLAKAVNGSELSAPGAAPDYITYTVATLDGNNMTVTLETGAGVWWTFNLVRTPTSPLVGNWKLDGEGAASVGPVAESAEWWASTSANGGGPADRACWFDDVYQFNADGSFANVMGGETWVEAWQGGADMCGLPAAPHDGSQNAIFQYDSEASTLKLTGLGAHIGLAKAANGAELSAPGQAPGSITYDITTLDGDNMTVTLETGAGVWWTFRLKRVSSSPLVGNWKLAGDGAASVGPVPESSEWWASNAANGAGPAERGCWFDDIYNFSSTGSFQGFMGGETWVEAWQGGSDACEAPVGPHDGSISGSFVYDEAAGTLTVAGTGAYLGLAKAVNGEELTAPAGAPASVTYNVITLDSDNVTLAVESGAGVWWTFRLMKVKQAALAGKWKLDGDGAASVGPVAESAEWWASTAANGAGPAGRSCWFDDVYDFGSDGLFANDMGEETWVEGWQGGADSCAAPVGPHDGSAAAAFDYDEDAGTLTIIGRGAHLGLAKVVNGSELGAPGDASDSVTYTVVTLDGDNMIVTLEAGAGVWWTFRLVRSKATFSGNWKLAGEGAAAVGPNIGSAEWWSSTAANGAGPAERSCLFDDVFHFGADGSFQNFMDGATWVEGWQGGSDACDVPVSPHDGASAGSFTYQDVDGSSHLVISGRGSHLGLAKAVNGQELASTGETPDSVDYLVTTLDGTSLTVSIESGAGVWWTFQLAKE